MYVVLIRGEVVYESANPAGVVAFLDKTGPPTGALVLNIWTPEEFTRRHTPKEPTPAAAVATGKKTNGRKW